MMKPHFAGLLATAALFACDSSPAAIVASGLRDIVISSDFDGVYLDLDAGVAVGAEAAGWDLNAFFGGEAIANSPNFHPVAASITRDAPLMNLAFGQAVGDASLFASTHPGGYSSSALHIGTAAGQFASGSEGYLGFRSTANNDSTPLYGRMRLVLSNTGSTGLIRDWAYDNSGAALTVGAVPEPSALTLLVACGAGFAFRRRR